MKISITGSSLTVVAFATPSMGAVKAICQTDFSSQALGTVQTGTQCTAGTPGQGGRLILGVGHGFYDIENDPSSGGARGKIMAITGNSSDTSRLGWRSVSSGWSARDAVSDEIRAVWEQDANSSTSTNRFG